MDLCDPVSIILVTAGSRGQSLLFRYPYLLPSRTERREKGQLNSSSLDYLHSMKWPCCRRIKAGLNKIQRVQSHLNFTRKELLRKKNRVRAFVSFSSFRLCHHCKFSKFLDCARETNLQCINCLAEIPKNRFALGKVEESTEIRYALPI